MFLIGILIINVPFLVNMFFDGLLEVQKPSFAGILPLFFSIEKI
ncbi:hypothetical protein BC624_103105 [Flavobacterium granuli]|uniref:Uncharacterized protein n=1 Tax=Flavobacterium granuli TaxID=280093 RepID=A0A1M5MPA3_9FLAO|nr:hypothetical protein BC624_103105 [Flavobacterium granuli]SHG79244.1 hypothetical protein SAMN05443373_104104 [Flavobacterium granuli]